MSPRSVGDPPSAGMLAGLTTSPGTVTVPRSGACTRAEYTEGNASEPPESSAWSFTEKVPSAALTACVTGSGAPPAAGTTPSGAPSWFSSRTVTSPVTSSGSAPGTVLSKKMCAFGTGLPEPSTIRPVKEPRMSAREDRRIELRERDVEARLDAVALGHDDLARVGERAEGRDRRRIARADGREVEGVAHDGDDAAREPDQRGRDGIRDDRVAHRAPTRCRPDWSARSRARCCRRWRCSGTRRSR